MRYYRTWPWCESSGVNSVLCLLWHSSNQEDRADQEGRDPVPCQEEHHEALCAPDATHPAPLLSQAEGYRWDCGASNYQPPLHPILHPHHPFIMIFVFHFFTLLVCHFSFCVVTLLFLFCISCQIKKIFPLFHHLTSFYLFIDLYIYIRSCQWSNKFVS